MVDLKGKLVFLTGAASGIGRALARELLKEGCRVVAFDRDEAALASLQEEATLLGFAVDARRTDVADREFFLSCLKEAAAANGAPDIFINNAGIAKVGGFLELGLDSFEQVLRVDLSSVAYGSHFALSKMRERGGVLVNMGSMAGQLPGGFMASYCAAKFGVVGFTRALQAELSMAHSPVRAVLVCPGFVETPNMDQPGAPFPWFLRWLVEKPGRAAAAIVRGLKSGKAEIYPDAGGRLMRLSYRVAPGLTVRSSRLLLAKSVSQLLGRAPIQVSPKA